MQEVLVFGQLGKAVFQKNEDFFLVDLDRPDVEKIRQGDLSFLFDLGTEVKAQTYTKLEPEILRKDLEEMEKGHDALEMAFDCFDPDLDEDTLLSCADAAEELLADEKVFYFVTKRMFSRPLPKKASRSFPHTIIEENKFPNLARLLSLVFDYQQAINKVRIAWESVANQAFTDIHLAYKTQNLFVEEGVFAFAVRALFSMDQNKLGLLPIQYFKDPNLKSVSNLQAILTRLHAELKKHLPKEKPPELVSEYSLTDRVLSGNSRKSKKRVKIDQFHLDKISALKRQIVQSYLQGKIGEAEISQKELCDYQKDNPKYLCMSLCDIAGQIVNKVGLLETAIEIYKLAVKKNKKDPVPWSGMAGVHKAMREYPAALEKYEKAQELEPSNVIAWRGMAEVYKAMREYDTALEKYEKAQELDPSDVIAWCGMAEVYKAMREYDTALKNYKKAQELDPSNVIAWNGMAEVYKAKREYDTALEMYGKAQELDPSDVIAWNGMAEVYKAMNMFDKAEAKYLWANEKLIPDPVSLCGLGFLWLKAKPNEKWAESDGLFKSALKIDPGNPIASLGLEVIGRLFHRSTKELADQEWFKRALAFLSEDKNLESRDRVCFLRDLETIDRDDPITRLETLEKLGDIGSYLLQEMPL